jgi:hypothetical protein
MATKTKKPKEEQKFIPGTEPKRVKELDAAAAEYEEGRDERMEATEKEVALKKTLIELMQKHKLERYVIPGSEPQKEIVLVAEDISVKVRAVKKPKAEGNANGDGMPF